MNIIIKDDINFSDITTFKLGGHCLGFVDCQSVGMLKKAVSYFRQKGLKFIVIGQGSNILASDKGLDCYVIRFFNRQDIDLETHGDEITVDACGKLDLFVEYAVANGYFQMVNFSGIPGSVAGAIVGNAGAFGSQISDNLLSVEIIDCNGEIKHINAKDVYFSYRDSGFKDSRDIIISATFSLVKSVDASLKALRNDILQDRWSKHPDVNKIPCAGSFFRNVELEGEETRKSAGWFLDQIGAKQMTLGGASVFPKHANIIIKNQQNCTAQEVLDLSKEMSRKVRQKFDIDLIREIILLGEFDGVEG